MSIGLYDKALTKKIQDWIVDPNVVVMSPDDSAKLFMWKADITNDKPIELPLIVLTRDSNIKFDITAKRTMSFSGKTFNSNRSKADHLNAIPVTLNYQLNIYTRYREEADEYLRNFIFNFVNHPKMVIDIPYNDSNLQYTSFISLEGTATDNSSIPERLVSGQFFRYTLNLIISDAYMFSYNFKSIPKYKFEGVQATKDLNNKKPDFKDNNQFVDIT